MPQLLRISRIVVASLALGGAYPAAVSAQGGGPLLKSDLVRMMTASNYSGTEMAALVRTNCIGFEPTARDRNQLATLPGSEFVMVEIDRCVSKSRPATGSDSDRGVVPTAPVENRIVRTPPRPDGEIVLVDLAVEPAGPVAPVLQPPRTATTLRSAEIPSLVSRQTRPRLTNWNEVTTAFLHEYRPRVRSSGTVILSLTVGTDGSVLEAAVKQSTGDQAMAEAALRVTRIMKFQPAMMRDKAVESLTELPIHFSPK